MKIGIMQPYFFPYIGYWQLLAYVDRYVVYDDVNFIKRGWINRNNILLNGEGYMLTLPLDRASQNKKINEIVLVSDPAVRAKVVKTLELAYRRAPKYETIMPQIRSLIINAGGIAELNIQSIRWVCNYLELNTEILVSSQLEKSNELKGQDKIIDIVQRLHGDVYVNAIGGKELYDKDVFQELGITLHFLSMGEFSYNQFGKTFIPGLSIIDALMFCERGEIRDYLNCFTIE